jgi:hypothetical protein
VPAMESVIGGCIRKGASHMVEEISVISRKSQLGRVASGLLCICNPRMHISHWSYGCLSRWKMPTGSSMMVTRQDWAIKPRAGRLGDMISWGYVFACNACLDPDPTLARHHSCALAMWLDKLLAAGEHLASMPNREHEPVRRGRDLVLMKTSARRARNAGSGG